MLQYSAMCMWQNHAIDIVAIVIDRSRRSEALGRVPERKLCFGELSILHSGLLVTGLNSHVSNSLVFRLRLQEKKENMKI
jgi:hypothetical protein